MKTAKEIVKTLTLEEKAALLSGKDFWHTVGYEDKGVSEMMMSDGPHGLRKQSDAGDNLGVNDSIEAVCFPSAAGTAASFDRDLLYKMGETLGEECRAENVAVLLGPAVNMKRSPLCGRNFEYFSEDPYLAGELAASYINGVQSKGVGTSIKHFAVNSQEKHRMTVSSEVDERTLREIYLAAFETAVKKAQPATVMCAYNKVNGTYCSENSYLLNDILRKEWGFKGFVVSDWGAVNDRVKGVQAGNDLEMPSSFGITTKKLIAAVKEGRLDESFIDTACCRIIEAAQALCPKDSGGYIFDREADHKKAVDIAAQTMVLLKNNGILPLKKGAKVAFIGEYAKTPRYQGGGSSHINAHKITGALEAAGEGVTYSEGFAAKDFELDEKKAAQAIELAKQSDVVVIFAGLSDSIESEGFDRKNMGLPPCQNELIQKIAQVNPNVVVVLQNGSPVKMPWLDSAAAVLESYLGGEGMGEAQVSLLFGERNPCAKLAETFPLSEDDIPCKGNFPGGTNTVEYREGIFIGYRYYDTAKKDVLFPFGYGLSYTTFDYSDISVSPKSSDGKTDITVSMKVKNTGDVDGAEIVQLYVSKCSSEIIRAEQELKGFEKVYLKAGEEKEISFTLNPRAFSFYDLYKKDWSIEGGEYLVKIGASSRDIRLIDTVSLDGEEINVPYTKDEMRAYYEADVNNISDRQFELLLGRRIAPADKKIDKLTVDNTFEDSQTTKWGGRIVKLVKFFMSKTDGGMGNSEMMVAATLETPLRTTIAMSQGIMSERMAELLVNVLNGEKTGSSMLKLVGEAIKIPFRGK